jgi:hypothetical protein
VLHCIRKALVKVLREGWAWVVGQNADEHDRIVLDMGACVILLGKELANLVGGGGSSLGTGLGGFDDSWEMEDFFALTSVST